MFSMSEPSAGFVPASPLQPAAPAAKRDLIFDALCLVCSYLFCQWILFGGLGISVPLFVCLFYALSLAYLAKGGLHFGFSSAATLIPVVLLLLCFGLYDNLVLRFFNVLGLLVLIPLSLLYLSGRNEYGFFCAGSLWDSVKSLFVFPFVNLSKSLTLLVHEGRRSKHLSSVLMVLAGVLAISPVALIITLLLMSSDQQFSGIISGGLRLFGSRWLQVAGKLLLALLLTCPLFSFLYTLRHRSNGPQMAQYRLVRRVRVFDISLVNSALWVVCMIYALYVSTQISYFFSAFLHRLPSGFSTYAEYARRGFFELVAVAFINFLLISFAMLFSRRRENELYRASRVTIFALSVLTLMLIATAASKMLMYIQEQGLTPLRVYTSFFMLLLLLVFVFLMIKMLTPRFNFLRFSAVAALALYLSLNFFNTDAVIARHNIAQYQRHTAAGQKVSLDINLLCSLSDSMVPEAAALLNDPTYGAQTRTFFERTQKRLQAQRWESFTAAGALAQKTIGSQTGANG